MKFKVMYLKLPDKSLSYSVPYALNLLTLVFTMMASFGNLWGQQQTICEVVDEQIEAFSPNTVMHCPGGQVSFDDYTLTSPFTIYVNVHFGATPAGDNFAPSTAVTLANELIASANALLEDMEQNAQPGPAGVLPPRVPQAKWRYKLYTENLPGDNLGGIWIGSSPNSNMYNNKVIDIFLRNDRVNPDGTPTCYSGFSSYGGGDVTMFGFYFCQADGAWGLPIYARIMNHEFGHSLRLHHTSWCMNQCRQRDIDPEQECSPNCPELVLCDCENPKKILCVSGGSTGCFPSEPNPIPPTWLSRCTWNFSNNMMSQGIISSALTPCQWETVFNYVLNSNNKKYGWADRCTEIESDYAVQSGTSEVWDNIKLLNRDVVVKTGATLTIKCEVRMATSRQIIVNPGGTLILDGGKITSLCPDGQWRGVIVEGNTTQSQYPVGGVYAQGRFIGRSGSVIENAYTAVQLWGPDEMSSTGGILDCTGTTFRNNRVGVDFARYRNFWPYPTSSLNQERAYFGIFRDCLFETDQNYFAAPAERFHSFIRMDGVNGVSILASSFANTQIPAYGPGSNNAPALYGYGIHATDAGFRVDALCNTGAYPCSSYRRSTLTGLGLGIHNANIGDNRPFIIRRADFQGCYTGVHNISAGNGTILFNTFHLGNVPDPALIATAQSGVIFDSHMAGFTFQENQFIGHSGNAVTVGSVCKGIGEFSNVVRRNTYTGLDYGNVSDGKNATTPGFGVPDRGLHYLCNENATVGEADFEVTGLQARIRQGQGLAEDTPNGIFYKAAGNRFSYTAFDFRNGGAPIDYYYNPNAAGQTPVNVTGDIEEFEANPNTCPSDYCLPPCKTPQEVADEKDKYYDDRDKEAIALAEKEQALLQGDAQLAEEKAQEAAHYKEKMDREAYMVVIHVLHDTLTFKQDTLDRWIEHLDAFGSYVIWAMNRQAAGQPQEALAMVARAAAHKGLSDSDREELALMPALLDAMGNARGQKPSSSGLATLERLADRKSGFVGSMARSLLELHGYRFPPFFSLGGAEKMRPPVTAALPQPLVRTLSVAPNPASGVFRFLWQPMQASDEAAQLRITDLMGRTVSETLIQPHAHTEVDIRGAGTGIYLYQLLTADGTVETGRLVKQ